MASDTYYFTGMVQWAKVHTPDPKFEVYTIDLYLDGPSMKLFKDSGLQLEVRDGEQGQFIKLRRPSQKKFKKELIDLGPPLVLIKGENDSYVPFADKIGNGSQITAKVRVYDTQKGKGHELEAVAVEVLVPYVEGEKFTPDGKELPF